MQTFTLLAALLAAANTVVAAPWGPNPTGTQGAIDRRDAMKPTGTYAAGDLQKRSWPTASGSPWQAQARDEEAVVEAVENIDAGSISNWTAPRLAPRWGSNSEGSSLGRRDEVAAKVQSALEERNDAAPPTPVTEEQPTLLKRSDPEPEPEPQAPVENRDENHEEQHEESNQESQQQQDSQQDQQQQEHHEERHEEQQQQQEHHDEQQQQQEEHHDEQQQTQQEEHHDDQQQERRDDQQQQDQQQGELEQNRQESNWTVPDLSPRANLYTPLVDGEDDYNP